MLRRKPPEPVVITRVKYNNTTHQITIFFGEKHMEGKKILKFSTRYYLDKFQVNDLSEIKGKEILAVQKEDNYGRWKYYFAKL